MGPLDANRYEWTQGAALLVHFLFYESRGFSSYIVRRPEQFECSISPRFDGAAKLILENQ